MSSPWIQQNGVQQQRRATSKGDDEWKKPPYAPTITRFSLGSYSTM
jgi:hypothetical protein